MEWRINGDDPDTVPDMGPVPMQQHPAYGRACAALGSRVMTAVAGPPGDPVAAAQILIRRWPGLGDFALIAGGPVWLRPVAAAQRVAATRRLVGDLRRQATGVIITADPRHDADPLAGFGLLPLVTPGTRAQLALASDGPPPSAMHGKWRNRLRRAQSGPLRIAAEPVPRSAGHWLLRAETAQARRRRYRRLPEAFTLAWIAANAPDSALLVVARLAGDPVAAMLFLCHGAAASYHVGWSGAPGRAHHAHNLILWRAGAMLADRGCRSVDLGTIDTETAPGLARFKLGAGAAAMAFGATWLDAPGARFVARAFRARRAG